MKRKLTVLLALFAQAALSLTVLADPSITDTGNTVEEARWIYNTDLMQIRTSNGYYIADSDGNALTEDVYNSSFSWNYGYVTASLISNSYNSNGVLDKNAAQIIPFEYGSIKILSNKWIICYKLALSDANQYDFESYSNNNYYLIDSADLYYISGGAASKVATFARENILDIYAHGDYISVEDRSNSCSIYDSSFNVVASNMDSVYSTSGVDINDSEFTTFYSNGQYGIQDADGNVILEPSFQYIYSFRNGYAEVSTGNTRGLVDTQGNIVVPAEYEAIKTSYYGPITADSFSTSTYDSAGYFAVVKNGRLGFVGPDTQLTFEPSISESLMDLNGASATYTDMGGDFHILAADGADFVVPAEYTKVRAMNYASGLLYSIQDNAYNEGLMDWHGNILLPCEYYDITISGNGHYLLVKKSYQEPIHIYTIDYGIETADIVEAPETEIVPETEIIPETNTILETEPAPETEEITILETEPETQEIAETEPQAEDPVISAVRQLLSSASMLINTDLEGNKDSILSLLKSSAMLLQTAKPEAAALITSAATLLESGIADASVLSTLLSSAASFM